VDKNNTDVTANPPVKTAYSFTNREWDQDAGMYYYRARYYDPGIGRFIQEDPHPGILATF
jgi:RHS repeat-associated protein